MNSQMRSVQIGPAKWNPFPVITIGCLWAIALIAAKYAWRQKPAVDIGSQIILMGVLVVAWIWLDRQCVDTTLRRIFFGIAAAGAIVTYCIHRQWGDLLYDALLIAASGKYLFPANDQTRAASVRASGLFGTVEYDSMHFSGMLVEEYSPDWTRQLSCVRTDDEGRFELPRTCDAAVHHIKISWPGVKTAFLDAAIVPDAQPLVIRLKVGRPKSAEDWGQ